MEVVGSFHTFHVQIFAQRKVNSFPKPKVYFKDD